MTVRLSTTFCRWRYGSVFIQIFLVGSVKRFFCTSGRSRSSKVIDFGTNRKRVCDFLLVRHSNLGSCTVSEISNQIAKNCCRQPPHSHLTPPPTGTPASIRIYLIFPETRVIGLHFCHVWVYLHSNLCSGLHKTHLFCTRVRFGGLAVQGL